MFFFVFTFYLLPFFAIINLMNNGLKLKLTVIVIAALVVGIFGVAVAWGSISQLVQDKPAGGDPAAESNSEIDGLNRDIEKKKQEIETIKQRQGAYKQAIAAKQQEKADLQNQLAIFDNRLAATQLSVEKVKADIEQTQLEIKKLDLEISVKEEEIKNEKEQIAVGLSLLYKEGNKSDWEIMLLNDNFSDYIDQIKQLKDLNNGISDSLDNLKKKQASLKDDRQSLTDKKTSLNKLQADLIAKQNDLQTERGSKQLVLDQTKSSEAEYQRLLTLARREQEAAAADIANMEKVVRQRLSGSKKFAALDTSAEGFIWPVSKNVITAYFHDPEYPFRNIFEHPAVDVRAGQGTPVRAAASGYVARVKNGGARGYSYIMLIHNDGLSTVYGHVSGISVTEEQYVDQGQVIGLSGGMPGTPGAGPLTTGPHLHFEIRFNGIPVDPLEYLP